MDSQWLEDCAWRRGRPRGARGTSYRLAVPLAIAIVGALWMGLPECWIRLLFHRTFDPLVPEFAFEQEPRAEGPIRLIPLEMLPVEPAARDRADSRRVIEREVLVEDRPARSDEDAQAPGTERSAWTWDPTSAYAVSRELTAAGPAQAAADSVVRRAILLRSLRLADLDPALAMLDTTQSALAREQFHAVDRWYVRNWARLWQAQGAAARLADIYERAVLEAERDGGM